jgi:hypothetical protein
LSYADIPTIPACGDSGFLSAWKEQVCVFVATKTSRMPVGIGQTCLLRPMVAKGKNGRNSKELNDGSNSKNHK